MIHINNYTHHTGSPVPGKHLQFPHVYVNPDKDKACLYKAIIVIYQGK